VPTPRDLGGPVPLNRFFPIPPRIDGIGQRAGPARAPNRDARPRAPAPIPALPSGRPTDRGLCQYCFRKHRREHEEMLTAAGPKALARFRESGDPAKQTEA
jgi:hypothetical protein